ncbi:MAG TPA: glycosyltransferase family 2 protein [Syntrophales bacterium]|nr:glycosyltransferase family 2 protein [Syntrophales bacterium]HQN77885.1 glycosyltransferase family 2 protein [Syntrophales bacterium]HQQ27569.1 glycosyltransferase family 2 protein [Syntrophales bacterium]
MKLIIQIPCYNEAGTIAVTLAALPREMPGFDAVEWLIIDDGSTDDTARVAQENGVDHIVRHTRNQGLARAFMTGLDACLSLGADCIVNTDADNQYNADDIPLLVAPVLEGRADIVVGARPIETIEHFSLAKKFLQKLGSWVVRVASRTDIPDAPSGFRAFSREAAMQLNVFNEYTYTLETIIQAGQKNMAITSVPVRVNQVLRPSRLVSSIPSYVKRSIVTIVRIFAVYQPFRFFCFIGFLFLALSAFMGLRFSFFFFQGHGNVYLKSLIVSGFFLILAFQMFVIGFQSDLIGANRKILEKIIYRLQAERNGGRNADPPGMVRKEE